ncbi:glycosyltransferase [Phycicoccus sp. DTK01]|uniref:glycosyltransferase n=1 Tax=Phycicoccus sp. DTK01 TaxID=2785745 RepID=UPI001A8F581C|nr:glycosyltransferase [Phycicoccus sp. DTK01]GIL34738.1 hypothetical protein PDTK01_08140 [Phycicoccus sp. DTK01]
MSAARTQPFRVLLSAYVDLNVIDGSAFFVAGVASLLTSAPGMEVHVVAATPIRRPVVVQEMLVNDRVTLTDPFRDRTLTAVIPELDGATRMDEPMLARVLAHYDAAGHHDVVVVRSTEVAHALSQLRPDLGPRLCVYVTGVVADDQDVDPGVLHRLQALADRGATLLCQTPEMREHLLGLLRPAEREHHVAVLTPAVPSAAAVAPVRQGGPLVLAYTGKFAPAWHTVEMLSAVKEAAAAGADLRLLVAGDHFKRPADWPTFPSEVRHLLGSHPAITWTGAITREDARALVSGADVGVGWRHASLDSSLELSTKLLEHGVLGRPCIINPTPMHQRLFGVDYPLFASSMTEFVDLLLRLDRDRGLVEHAAAIAHDVAVEYTYEKVFGSVFPTLLEASGTTAGVAGGFSADIAALTSGPERVLHHDGRWVAWLTDPRDAVRVLATVGPDTSVHDVERRGPFIRWSTEPLEAAGSAAEVEGETLVGLLGETFGGRGPAAVEVGPAGATAVAHDVGGRVRLASPGPDAVGGPAGDAEQALVRARRAEAEVERLRHRLDALAGSPLGRLQRRYWRLRRRSRGRARP